MNTKIISNLAQLVTSVAVLVGLGLVVWELRQTQEIAKAQQATDGFAIFSQRVQAMMGDSSAHSVAKACDEPDSLTTEDMVILNAVYTETLNNMRQIYTVQLVSGELAIYKWEEWSGNFRIIFATEYGRWWWKTTSWEVEIKEAGDRFLKEHKFPPCSELFDGYRNRNELLDSQGDS